MSRLALLSTMLVLVLLAGCNGFSLSGSSDVRTVTPADVPTDLLTETPNGRLAPGVFPTKINASALASAHARILGSTTFTIRTNRTYRYPNGTVRGWISTKTAVDSEPSSRLRIYSRTRYSQSYRDNSDDFSIVTYEQWYSPDHIYQQLTFANNTTTYRVDPFTAIEPFQFTRAWRIEDMFMGDETRVIPRNRNGSTYYRIERSVSTGDSSDSPNSSKNGMQWLLVDSRGVVHEHHITSTTAGLNGTPLRLHLSISYVRMGNTTVERPSWVDTARNHTTPRTERRS